jgi:hypothetical protein
LPDIPPTVLNSLSLEVPFPLMIAVLHGLLQNFSARHQLPANSQTAEEGESVLLSGTTLPEIAVHHGPEARRARENSQKQVEPRLSKQIHELKKRADRGRWIAEWVAEDWNNWYHLNAADRNLWVEYDSENMKHKKVELKAQQKPRFPGAAESLALWTDMLNEAL